MTKNLKKLNHAKFGAIMMGAAVAVSATEANAAGAGGNNFSAIAQNIGISMSSLPGLMSALAYLMGVVLGILGVLKIKDHVENPTQTPLKDGAIRLAVGGALFALPILFESMFNTIGSGSTTQNAQLYSAQFSVK